MRRSLVVALLVSPWLFPASSFARDLTFEDRVNAQEAIERVYYSHQIGATRPFEEVVPRAVLEAKVRTYLEESVALETRWKTPITAQALERELERMAHNTRLPDRLKEIYSALGNDGLLILECVARPALADRLARNFFAYDQTIHGAERQKADEMWQALMSGAVSVNDDHPLRAVSRFVRTESGPQSRVAPMLAPSEGAAITGKRIELDPGEYSHALTTAPAIVGAIGAVTEEREAFVIRVVLEETVDSFSLASYVVPKVGWDQWWTRSAPELSDAAIFPVQVPDSSPLRLGQEAERAAVFGAAVGSGPKCDPGDTWSNGILDDLPDSRASHTAIWTGVEMLVWGGVNNGSYFNSGGRYDPATDTWSAISTINAPTARYGHTAVWTGTQMIVWGGSDDHYVASGGRYNPNTDTWSSTSTTNAPTARGVHTAVWTGNQMIVWGGADRSGGLKSGGRYDPDTDTWSPTATVDSPTGRSGHSAVWTGVEMIIWGGFGGGVFLNSGSRYDPATNAWSATSTTNSPIPRSGQSAIWTGTWMIVWGGSGGNSGGRYDPTTDAWSPTSTVNAPAGRSYHSAVWAGTRMIVWGGYDFGGTYLNSGGGYDPATDTWSPTSTINAPPARIGHTAVWTESQMIVWGGSVNVVCFDSGGRYDPATDTWSPTSTGSAPIGRLGHTAVWTGSEMIVWGGVGNFAYLNSGGRYDPTTDTWSPTSIVNAPSARQGHTAAWTGAQMIVWGGIGTVSAFNSGGRYDPIADVWSPTSTTNAPAARSQHVGVWTGSRMVIWGGNGAFGALNSGGRYEPVTDTWLPTSTVSVPGPRYSHTAVWTGTQMIVWGGFGAGYLNSGGRYDPSADTWLPTSTTNAPTGRLNHTAVWTGVDMIVWGGNDVATGGRYDPSTDSWRPTTTTDAPAGRLYHSAVWTGIEMIIWGGGDGGSTYLQSGGRYDPATDTWSPTTPDSAPMARYFHTAVWTGTRMILWGGYRHISANTYLRSGGSYSPGPSFDLPVADAGPDQGEECVGPEGASVRLQGSATGCGALTFTWTGPFAEGGGSVQGDVATVTLPLGQSSISLRVEDALGQSTTDTLGVTVRDTTPPVLTCPSPLAAECTGPDGAQLSPTATAVDACSPSVQMANSLTSGGASAAGSYPLGTTPVAFSATDPSGNVATCAVPVKVRDTTPPTLAILADPPSLWPPNHDLVAVHIAGQVRDICDPNPQVALVSVTSSEPDDAPGAGDGNTTGDIAGADLGTADGEVNIRAERNGIGPGRVYQMTYRAVDSSGNATPAFALVTVPHDQGSGPEPLLMRVEPDGAPGRVRVYWSAISDALGYDVISGDLSQAKVEQGRISLGAVRVLARSTTETALAEDANSAMPATGTAIFYLIQSRTDRGGSGYGTESAPWPRVPASCDGGCP